MGQFDFNTGQTAAGVIDKSIFDAKGDLIAASADDTAARLAVGSNNEYLVAASGETTGIKWQTIPATDVEVSELSTATYDDVQDYINFFGDRTILSGGTISDAGSGVATIASLTGWCKVTDDDDAIGKFFDYDSPGNTGTLTDMTTHYVYVDYNGGSPQLVTATSIQTFGHKFDHILIATIFRHGATLHWHQHHNIGIQRANVTDMHHLEESNGHRAYGMVTSDGGSRTLSITEGALYEGIDKQPTPPFDTPNSGTADQTEAFKLHDADGGFAATDVGKTVHNTGGDNTYAEVTAFITSGELTLDTDIFTSGETYDLDIFSYWYATSSGTVWNEVTGSTLISNTQYNDITNGGLSNLTGNKYGIHWVYMELDGGHFHVVYGQDEYNGNQADDASAPSTLPNIITSYCILIAKIILQKDQSTMLISYPWTTVFSSTLATNHDDLAGLAASTAHTQYMLNTVADANAMLYSVSDNTPDALAMAASRIPARLAAGDVIAATGAQVLTVLSGQAGAAFDWNSQNLTGIGTLNAHTIPGGTDTFAMLTATQVFTNKTLTSPTINGTIGTTGLTMPAFIASGTITVETAMDFSVNTIGIRGNTTEHNYWRLMAYDVDGAAYVQVARIVNRDNPYIALGGGAGALQIFASNLILLNSAIALNGQVFDAGSGNARVTTTGALALSLQAAMKFTDSDDSATVANEVSLSGYDIDATHRVLAISSEEAVVTETVTSDRTLRVRLNGATYKFCLKS